MTNDERYKNGVIYTIRSFQTDKYYIGSTCMPLPKRLYQHKLQYKRYLAGKYNNVSSFEIVQYDDCYIELLELFSCENKQELTKREGELIRQFKYELVNIKIEGRTLAQYYLDNHDKIKQYRIDNQDKIKQYSIENRQKIVSWKNATKLCKCGRLYTNANKSRHELSDYHKKIIECFEYKPEVELNKVKILSM